MQSTAAMIAILLLLSQNSEPNGQQIMTKAHHMVYGQGNDQVIEAVMTITIKGRQRIRDFSALRLNVNGDDEQKTFLYFRQPQEVAGMVFFTWTKPNDPDDQRLYFPSLDSVQRIAPGDTRTSFANSHFFYEDMTGRNPNLDNHELTGQTDDYYIVKSTPKEKKFEEFDYYEAYVHRQTFMPVQLTYFKNSAAYRTLKILEVKTFQGKPTATKIEVTDGKIGAGSSIMIYNKVEYDVGLTDDMFSEPSFRSPPAIIRR